MERLQAVDGVTGQRSEPAGVTEAGQTAPDPLSYRAVPVGVAESGTPTTYNGETHSVEVVGVTEAPVMMWDYDHGRVPEVLLMSGMQLPPNGQVPLLDTHSRYNTYTLIGSYRGVRREGQTAVGTVHFSSIKPAPDVETKVAEGHLTDFSAGYRHLESHWVPAGETHSVDGRSWEGPMLLRTKWTLKELSACPIGADENAKARSDHNRLEQAETEEGDDAMNKEFRKYLESRGLSTDATEVAAYAYAQRLLEEDNADGSRSEGGQGEERSEGGAPAPGTPAGGGTPAPASPAPESPGAGVRSFEEGMRLERERSTSIRAIGGEFGLDGDWADRMVNEGQTVEAAQRQAMSQAVQTLRQTPVVGVRVTADERDKFRAAAADSLLIRMNTDFGERQPAAGATDLAGRTSVELCREICQRAGVGSNGNPQDVVQRAMSTSDFPEIIGAGLRTQLNHGWDDEEETWDRWTDPSGEVGDFEQHTLIRTSEFSDLDEIGEVEEYRYGKITEGKENFQIYKYGKLCPVSWELMLADQLGEIMRIPAKMGAACRRKGGDVVYAVLTGNAALNDGVALFHATHSNLVAAGSGAAVSVTTLNVGQLAMGSHKDLQGLRRLNINPAYYIGPKAVEGASRSFFRREKLDNSSGVASNEPNTWKGRLEEVYEPRLDDSSTTAWYLAAKKTRTVRVYFLRGERRPVLSRHPEWKNDTLVWKVRFCIGAAPTDYRGLYENAGA